MKTLLKVLLGLLAVLLLLFFGGGMALSGEARVERKGLVPAPPFAVQAVVEDLSTWPEWSSWNQERDPQAEWSFEGEPGEGMRWSWASEGPLGTGSLTVLGSTPERVDFELRFEDASGLMVAQDSMLLVPTEDGTEVTWSMEHTFEPLLLRWIVQLGVFDAMLGADYEGGLVGLAARFQPEDAGAPGSEG